MQYSEGYLAFIDILGFSNYVKQENNGEKTDKLFQFIEKLCYLFNSSPELNVNISFFSDTIILTSNDIVHLIIPIYMAESYLKNKLGLLFRGSIVFGKYYHNNGTTFGPAVVSAFELEKKAIFSRIIIDNTIVVDNDKNLYYYDDIDGYKTLNPYCMILTEKIAYGDNGACYPDDIDGTIQQVFENKRTELLNQIEKYRGTAVIDKYLWRVRTYNYTCRLIMDIPCGEKIYNNTNHMVNENLKKKISELIISDKEVYKI